MKMKEIYTKCELAMMGKTIPVESNEEAVVMTDYILKTIWSSFPHLENKTSGEEVINDGVNRYGTNKIKYITTSRLLGEFLVITYALDDGEEPFPEDLATDEGVLCYVYNINAPELSELGYCFFQKKSDGYYYRVG